MPTPRSTIDLLAQGKDVTAEDLSALRADVGSLPETERATLRASVEEYAKQREQELRKNADAAQALKDLKEALAPAPAPAGTGEQIGREIGGVAGKTVEETVERGKALGYRTWKELRDPENHLSTKVLSGLGILATLYGIYRVAKWVKGKPQSTWGGRLLRFMGATALSGGIIHWLGSPVRGAVATQAPLARQPVATPRATKRQTVRAKPAAQPSSTSFIKKPAETPKPIKDVLLGNVPEDRSLLGQSPIEIILSGNKHVIAFKNDGIYLDGIKYTLSAIDVLPFGGDAQLSILDVRRKGNDLLLKAGALGKEGTVRGGEAMIQEIVTTLLRGRPYRSETDDGTTIEIAKQMY